MQIDRKTNSIIEILLAAAGFSVRHAPVASEKPRRHYAPITSRLTDGDDTGIAPRSTKRREANARKRSKNRSFLPAWVIGATSQQPKPLKLRKQGARPVVDTRSAEKKALDKAYRALPPVAVLHPLKFLIRNNKAYAVPRARQYAAQGDGASVRWLAFNALRGD